VQQSNAESVHTTSARWQFERDVYEFARNLKLSKKDAKKQITRARQICGQVDHDRNGPALGNKVPDVTELMVDSPVGTTTAHHQDLSLHGEAPLSPQPYGGDKNRKRKIRPEGPEAYSPTSSKKKKKVAGGELDKQGIRSGRQISSGAEEEGPKAGACSRMKGKRNKTGADSEVLGPKGFALDPSEDDAQPMSGAELNVASSAPPDNTAASNRTSVRLASALSNADRAQRKERKKQRRIAERLSQERKKQRRTGERLSQKSTRDDQHARKTSGPLEPGNPTVIATLPSGAIDSTEPNSQAEAHENCVRANERDPNEGGPSMKEKKKDKRKSKETTAALDAELRALNAFSNEQQIENLDQGQLNGVSKAVKDDIKDAKAEQERMREDDKAGKRKVEKSIQTSAEKARRKKRVTESSLEGSERKRKRPEMKHKSSESGFPHPNDSVGVTAADEGLSSIHYTKPSEANPQPVSEEGTTAGKCRKSHEWGTPEEPPTTPTRLFLDIDIDIDIEFPWSDSPLSSAPSSPTPPSPLHPHNPPSHNQPHTPLTLPTKPPSPPLKRRPSSKVSPYFPTPPRPPRPPTSCIPFPPLSAPRFGLLQETLSHTPFHLLLACIFLSKTRGSVALPLFYTLITRYPTPSALATADVAAVIAVFQNLGLQNQRGRRVVALAKAWVEDEPRRGRRWRRRGYPRGRDGRDIKACEEPIPDEEDDSRVAWEIGHLPGVGRYALDSWRMFCRDRLRGVERGMGDYGSPFCEDQQPPSSTNQQRQAAPQEPSGEWTLVLPTDKELRAYLRWRWLRHGWEWDAVTGERRRASEKVIREAEGGGVDVEGGKGKG